jgi:hypothetical protein
MNGVFVRVHNDKEPFESDEDYAARMKVEPEFILAFEEYV